MKDLQIEALKTAGTAAPPAGWAFISGDMVVTALTIIYLVLQIYWVVKKIHQDKQNKKQVQP